MNHMSIIAKLRLLNKYQAGISFEGRIVQFDDNQRCDKCGVRMIEWDYHLLVECPYYSTERKLYIIESQDTNAIKEDWLTVLIVSKAEVNNIRKIYLYMKRVLECVEIVY